MKEKPNNIISFPGGGAAANDALSHRPEEADRQGARGLRAAILWHRVQYAVRLLLSIVLMALQGPIGIICRFVGVWTAIALAVLWFFPVPAGLLWAMGGGCLALLLIPLLLDLLVYWTMPTK